MKEEFLLLYRNFGKTNEKISVLGFGCMRLPVIGDDPTSIDEQKAVNLIRYAVDHGVNFIDTAYPYHGNSLDKGGESEPLVAKALKNGYRDKVLIATKLPSWAVETREDMERFLNEQLERLETDCIDFYMIHGINRAYWENLTALGFEEFLDDAINNGKIKHAGFSFHDRLNLFKEVVDHYNWSFCLIQLNYLDDNYQAGVEGLKFAASRGLGVAVMEPLKGGNLATDMPPEVQKLFDNAEFKRSPAEWALRWVWNHPEVGVVLSGMNSMEKVQENIKIAEQAHPPMLSDKELDITRRAKDIFQDKLKIRCSDCGYCLPCPHGVNIPGNFSRYNEFFLFATPEMIEQYKFGYHNFMPEEEHATNCTECGECEEHCTQSIAIIKELKKVKELFKY